VVFPVAPAPVNRASSTRTLFPALASRTAVTSPVRPAPTTTTSAWRSASSKAFAGVGRFARSATAAAGGQKGDNDRSTGCISQSSRNRMGRRATTFSSRIIGSTVRTLSCFSSGCFLDWGEPKPSTHNAKQQLARHREPAQEDANALESEATMATADVRAAKTKRRIWL